jgi:Acetyltransferase (GNAT) domain
MTIELSTKIEIFAKLRSVHGRNKKAWSNKAVLDSHEGQYIQSLNNGLILRTVASVDEVERVSQFNGAIHGRGVVGMTRNLFLHHPNTCGRDLVYVEDTRTGQVVSSLCLIPWTFNYEGVSLQSGEMGIVGTLEPYRRRGLIRAQVEFFKQRLCERQCVLSHIQGIAYYYRQFGYEYSMPLEGGVRLTSRDLPKAPDQSLTFRLAELADLPVLMKLYDKTAECLAIHSDHDEAIWRYLMLHSRDSETESEVWLIQQANGQPIGYMRLPKNHFGDELTVSEISNLSFDAALAALHHVTRLAEERKTPGVRLCLPSNSSMMRIARSFGAYDMGTYAWQIHIPSLTGLLKTIGPALERRVARSIFAGLTEDIPMRLYRQSISLVFRAGKLIEVADCGPDEGGVISMPPQAFTPLVLGYRSFDEIHAAYPDANVSHSHRLFFETLFPKVQSFLYTIY